MPRGVLVLLFVLVACGGSSATAPMETSPVAATTDNATPATVEPDPRLVCARDEECQLIPSCDCAHCVASKEMDVEPCPNVCATSPCAALVARCRSGACTTVAATP